MLSQNQQLQYLARIESALLLAEGVLKPLACTQFLAQQHDRAQDAVGEAERKISDLLRSALVRGGEGWLCEEDGDDSSRLSCGRVWVVDPVDGTREFVTGIPEWCVSIGLIENGQAVAGGTLNPVRSEMFLGSLDCGVTYNRVKVRVREYKPVEDVLVLASRSEFNRGEWQAFEQARFTVQPMGSIAYKLSYVAAGMAHATWTLNPKHEWDIAAGVALVNAAGGRVSSIDGATLRFSRPDPGVKGVVASCPTVWNEIVQSTRVVVTSNDSGSVLDSQV